MSRQNRKNLFIISIGLFAAALFFIFLASDDQSLIESKEKHLNPSISSTRDLVDKHLKLTNKKMELRQMRVQVENDASAPRVGMKLDLPENWKNPPIHGAPMDSDKNELNSVSDLKNRKKQLNFQQPHPNVQGNIRERLDDQKFQQEYKKEFVRQYIENARLSGYEIVVNEDLIVISVKRINPVSLNPFDPNENPQ